MVIKLVRKNILLKKFFYINNGLNLTNYQPLEVVVCDDYIASCILFMCRKCIISYMAKYKIFKNLDQWNNGSIFKVYLEVDKGSDFSNQYESMLSYEIHFSFN